MITRELFVSVIERMRDQYYYDRDYSFGLSLMIDKEDTVVYHNSGLTSSLLDLLRVWFAADENGFCEIEFYCYVLNFGNNSGELESIESLYDRLVGKEE